MRNFDFVRSLTMAIVLGASAPAFAVGSPQVFDVRMVLKTTVATSGTLNNTDNPFLGEDAESVVYREPKTVTWHGLIWGVGSCAIAGRWETVTDAQGKNRVGGCVLWDAQTKAVTYLASDSDLSDKRTARDCDFGWQFFNVIGNNARLCEGAWEMYQGGAVCDDIGTLFELMGSGFGTVTFAGSREEITDSSRVESISGDLTGRMIAPSVTVRAEEVASCVFSSAWDYCACLGCADDYFTAVHGTWVIKYNPFYSHQYGKVVSIRDAVDFSEMPAVAVAIKEVEDYDPAVCGEFRQALDAARANVKTAEAAVEAVKYENLKAVEVSANNLVNEKTATNQVANDALQLAKEQYDLANAAYEKALYNQTNVNWEITYLNASRSEKVASGVGCVKLTAAIDELSIFDLVKMESSIPGLYGIRTCTSWAACTALVREFTDATAAAKYALVKAETALAAARTAASNAAADLKTAQDALKTAQSNLANITILQFNAAKKLEDAKTALDAAQKAYDDAGCGD